MPQTKFFLEKQLIKLSCTLALFILQNFKKILRADPELWDVPFSSPKWSIWPEQIFFGSNYYYYHLPIGPLHCGKFKKTLTVDPELWGCTIFGPKMIHLPQFFGGKIIKINLIYILAPFIVQNFKKILPGDPELWECAILGPKMAHFPKLEFFSENLLMSLVPFIHAYLHAKNQSQILIY